MGTVQRRQFIKWSVILVSSAVAVLLLLTCMAWGVLYWAHRQGDLHRWIEQSFHVRVHYQDSSVQWHGLTPKIVLKQVSVMASQHQRQVLSLSVVSAKVNLLASLWQHTLVADKIRLNGLTVNIAESASGHYHLVGFSGENRHNMSWQTMGPWLQKQGKVELADTHIAIKRYQRSPIIFSNISLLWQHIRAQQYFLAAKSHMGAHQPGKFDFRTIITGNIANLSQVRAQVYLFAKARNWANLLEGHHWLQSKLLSGAGQVKLWGQWAQGHLQRLHVLTQLHQIKLHKQHLKFVIVLQQFNENMVWRHTYQGWHLVMDHIPDVNDPERYRNRIALGYQQDKGRSNWQLAFEQVNVGLLSELAILLPQTPKSLRQWLVRLSPSGTLSDFLGQMQIYQHRLINYHLAGHVSHLQYHAIDDWPGAVGLQGQFAINHQQGTLQLKGRKVYLTDSHLFKRALPEIHLSMQLHWVDQRRTIQATLAKFAVNNGNVDWQSQGRFIIPIQHWHQATVNIASEFQLSQLQTLLPKLIPDNQLSPRLSRWLSQVIKQGAVSHGQWVWRGALNDFPYLNHQGVFQWGIMAHDLTLSPDRGWPVIQHGDLMALFDAPALSVLLQGGSGDGVSITKATASIHNVLIPMPIHVHVMAAAPVKNAMHLLMHSPLKSHFQGVHRWLDFSSGTLQSNIHVTIVPHDAAADETYGDVTLHQVTVNLPLQLHLHQVNGQIAFDDDTLASESLTGRFMGSPLHMYLGNSASNDHLQDLADTFTATGILPLASIQKTLQQAFPLGSQVVSGSLPFNFQLSWQGSHSHVAVTSDGVGLAIHLPAPFHKSASALLPISFVVHGFKTTLLSLQLGNRLAGQALLITHHHELHLSKAGFVLGHNTVPDLPKAKHIDVVGTLSQFNLMQWLPLLNHWKHALASPTMHMAAGGSGASWHRKVRVNIHINQLTVLQQSLRHLKFSARMVGEQWQLGVENHQVLGTIMLPKDWQHPLYVLDFAYLVLPKRERMVHLTASVMQRWPAVDFSANHLALGSELLGRLRWRSQPLPNGIWIQHFSIDHDQVLQANLNGEVVQHTAQVDQVTVSGSVQSHNWGAAFINFGYRDMMQAGKGKISGSLKWLGRLQKPILHSLSGSVQFDLHDGVIPKVNPGMMKVLGILNFGGIFSQISTHFSDFKNKGLSFNTIKGHYIIQHNIAKTKRVHIESPSMDIILAGELNLKAKTLDQTMVVIPHLSDGVALAVGLIGGPIAGIATWLGEKIIGDTILRNKGLIFHITGPWNHPKVSRSKGFGGA